MNRRRFLEVGVGSSVALTGCLFGGPGGYPGGTVTCGDRSNEALTDGSVEGSLDGAWRTAYGDRRNTGARLETTGPTGCPTTQWRARPTDADNVSFDYPPVVSDGYAVVSNGLYQVYAFDAATGEVEWESEVGSSLTEPLVVGDAVVVGGESGVYSHSLVDGSERWSRETSGPVDAAPKTDESRIYVATEDHVLLALDRDGNVEWRANVPTGDRPLEDDDEPALGTPAVLEDVVVVGGEAGVVAAVDRPTGELAWTRSFERDVSTPPTVGSNTVVVSSYHFLRALDPDTGDTQWTAYEDDVVVGAPALDDRTGTLYVQAGEFLESQNLTAVDVVTGEEQWRTPLGLPEASPVVGRDRVYVGAGSNLTAIDRDTHEIVWEMDPDGDIHGHPTLLDGVVYVCAVGRGLFAVA